MSSRIVLFLFTQLRNIPAAELSNLSKGPRLFLSVFRGAVLRASGDVPTHVWLGGPTAALCSASGWSWERRAGGEDFDCIGWGGKEGEGWESHDDGMTVHGSCLVVDGC